MDKCRNLEVLGFEQVCMLNYTSCTLCGGTLTNPRWKVTYWADNGVISSLVFKSLKLAQESSNSFKRSSIQVLESYPVEE